MLTKAGKSIWKAFPPVFKSKNELSQASQKGFFLQLVEFSSLRKLLNSRNFWNPKISTLEISAYVRYPRQAIPSRKRPKFRVFAHFLFFEGICHVGKSDYTFEKRSKTYQVFTNFFLKYFTFLSFLLRHKFAPYIKVRFASKVLLFVNLSRIRLHFVESIALLLFF